MVEQRRLGIGFRLWAGFGLLILLLVGQSAFSVLQFRKLQLQADALVQQHIGLLAAVGQLHDLAGQRQVFLRDLAAAKEPQGVEQAMTALQLNDIQWDGVAHRFTGIADTAELERVREASRIIVAAAVAIRADERKLLAVPAAEQAAEARARLVQDSTPRYQELNAMLRAFFSATKSDADGSIARNAEYLHNLLILIASVAGAALLFGASIAYFSTRGVVRPLALAREAASRVAQGDLSQELQRKGPGEIVALVGTLEEMRLSLSHAVTGIRQAADGVQDGSRVIERGNLSLSERTEEQASSLEETASSIEELTATVKQNADSAARASRLARDTTAVARRGGDAVRDVVATMQGIHEASRRIADIIGVIDGIAFQTNILALNAAVEAARAGEQGRGFAVVASEVRVLAQRAAQAAKEIKTLIHDSAARVDGGVQQVEAAGRTMDEIVGSATQADGVIAEIAAASAEQLAGIEQVNRAIVQMEGNTQQNAAMVEQAAAAAEHLARQADLLVSAVARFRLEGEAAARELLDTGGPASEAADPAPRLARVMRRSALGAPA